MRKSYIFMFGASIAGLIQGLALGSYGAFQDSQIYFEFYNRFDELGFFDAVQSMMQQTGKVEPVIMLLFAFESLLTGASMSEYWFLVFNMTLLNVLVSGVMFALMSEKYKNKKYLFFIALIVMSSYFAFAKMLYVWRSVLAFTFFILFVRETMRKRFIWAGIACLAHASYFLFILLFLLLEKISRSRKTYLYWLVGIGMAGALPLIASFPSFFGMFASAGANMDLYEEGIEHTLNAWLAISFSLIVLLLVRRSYMSSGRLTPLYLFCLMTVITSFVSYNSYYVMSRISVPAMLIVGFLPYLLEINNWRFQLARLCILFSVLPTARLLINLLTGDFHG